MLKKVLLVGAGAALVFALIFGRSGVSYVTTSVSELRQDMRDSVPVELQIKDARSRLTKIDPEIHDMMRQIAREELDIEKRESEMSSSQEKLDKSYAHIMRLKNHLEDGNSAYYVFDGQSYSNELVEKDLRVQFEAYKTRQETVNVMKDTLAERRAALEAARQLLAEMKSKRHEMEIRIENLEAQARMVEVNKTSSDLNFDDSQISKLSDVLDEIQAKISVEQKIVDSSGAVTGYIPMEETSKTDGTITEEIDTYFNGSDDDFVSAGK